MGLCLGPRLKSWSNLISAEPVDGDSRKCINVAVHGGTFTEVNNYMSGPSGIDILREASVPEAAYDSSARTSSPRCFPGTREQYIEDIKHWAVPGFGRAPAPIYWMRGPAGVGKSAIAQTCSEKIKRLGKLGAAFFFSINCATDPKTFFPSIAYQLSTSHPTYRDLVDNKIRHDTTLVHKAMPFQFQYLIEEPLRELEARGEGIGKRITVLVDGLDECEGGDAQSEIVRIIAAAVSDGTLPLCWAFFSRPESHIEATFALTHVARYCHKVILPISRDADREIELYLRSGFENILRRTNASMQTPWPSTEDMKTIVGAAHGLFIYTTTVLRFVAHLDGLGPQRRLRIIIDVILNRRGYVGTTEAPFAELDACYALILQRIPVDIFSLVHLFLALICRMGSPGVVMTANLLGLSRDQLETVYKHTSAVVHLEDLGRNLELPLTADSNSAYTQTSEGVLKDLSKQVYFRLGGQVSFYHKSFDDYLLDYARSGDYCVALSGALSENFVRLHLALDRSFSWSGPELVLAPEVPSSASSLSYPYINELINSLIKAWVYHEVGNEDPERFLLPGEVSRLGAERDFRKHLHVFTYLGRIIPAEPGRPTTRLLWGCECRTKSYLGTYITSISHSNFINFNVGEFKQMIKNRQQANIITPYYPNLTSRVKAFLRNKHDRHTESTESGLFCLGRGTKSVFWFWEIDHKLEYYREFRAINLTEGVNLYEGETFDSWPQP